MAYEAIDLDKICRTCLTETTDSKNLFTEECINDETLKLHELLLACTSLEINENDGLPMQICFQCVHYMHSSFTFQQQCRKSDSTLRALLSGALQTQLYQLKPLDNKSVTSFGDLLNSTSFHNETEENTFNDQVDTVDNCNNDVENVDNESFIEGNIQIGLDTIENKEAISSTINTQSNGNFNIRSGSTDLINPSNQLGNPTINLLNIQLQEEAISNNYLISKQDLERIKTEKKTVNLDETTQPLYPCEEKECVACFTTEKDLKNHTKSHRRPHFCKPCKQMFSSASTLSRHVNSKHQKGNKAHVCSVCQKEFRRSDDLKRHLRVHTGERPFRCEKCGKAFAQSYRLLEHMRAHSNEKNFVCAICGKAFSRYTSLLAHNKTHSRIKSHECKECGKKLCGAGSLAMHMKTHTGEKKYICNFCSKAFATPSNLTIHKRMHTGEKPYVCNTCGKAFPDQSRLTVHSRIHSGEKPYVCSYCDRGCISSSQLKKHIRIHTGEKPYQCDMCEKRFFRSEDLKIHLKIHKGERNHICVVCQKGFYQATTLKVHMRIHTGEKPYSCNICNKSFSQTGPFSLHLKTHQAESNKPILQLKSETIIEEEKIIHYM